MGLDDIVTASISVMPNIALPLLDPVQTHVKVPGQLDPELFAFDRRSSVQPWHGNSTYPSSSV